MAHQVNPLRTLVTDEFKEINTENYEDYFDKAQEEVARVKVENTELLASNEKLTKKLVKKKNELEIEKTNVNTFRLYIQELNAKVQQLERAAPPLNSPTIHPVQNPILNTVINEEFVERLVIEKSGLESQICEQRREIELLNSELISCKGELTNKTESQTNASALAQEVTKLETDILLKIQESEESNSYSLKLEAECKLGKQLFQDALNSISAEKEEIQQQLAKERGLNEKLHLDIEQLNSLNELQNSKLTEHLKEMDTSQSNEDKLQIHKLENENTQLKDDAHILSAKIEEQNLHLQLKSNKIQSLQANEIELDELKSAFRMMSKESNNLIEEIEGMKTQQFVNEIQIKDLTDSIREYKRRDEELNNELTQLKHSNSVAMEGQVDSLKAEISKLENSNKQLSKNFESLEIERNAKIKELTEIQAKQHRKLYNNNKHHLSRLQEKDESIKILANELETIKADLGNERDEILRGKELEISRLRQEFEGQEIELRNEVTQ